MLIPHQVVPETSAVLGLPNEVVLPLNANHRDICRFASKEDQGYILVQWAIQDILSGGSTSRPPAVAAGGFSPIPNPVGQPRELKRPFPHPEDQSSFRSSKRCACSSESESIIKSFPYRSAPSSFTSGSSAVLPTSAIHEQTTNLTDCITVKIHGARSGSPMLPNAELITVYLQLPSTTRIRDLSKLLAINHPGMLSHRSFA